MGALVPPPPPPPRLLLLLVGLAALPGTALLVLPPLSNVSYAFNERRCQLHVRWNPVEDLNGTCKIEYHSAVSKNGTLSLESWSPNPSRTLLVAPGRKVDFVVRTACSEDGKGEGKLFNISLPQNGTAGTEAVDITYVWHNVQYVVVSWKRGKNADRDTSYNVSYWYEYLEEERPCTNYTREGDTFRCVFNFAYSGAFSISIQGNSRDVRPVCIVKEGLEDDLPKKLHPPSITNVTKSSDGVSLTWTRPINFTGICYEVEVNSTGSNKTRYEDFTKVGISLKPHAYHTLRVRAILGRIGSRCNKTQGLWSDWSNRVHWDERENQYNVLVLTIILLCVTMLTILLLVYLKRIKLLILPTIPDPGKFLKQMLEEQGEDLHKPFTKEPIKDEQTHVMLFVKPVRNEN